MEETNELRALSFNVWIYGTKVPGGLELVADAIIDSQADVVTLVEVADGKGKFVEDLKAELAIRGVTYYGSVLGSVEIDGTKTPMADTAIISRWPILEETMVWRTDENCVVRSLIDKDGKTVVVYGTHLEYRYYTCYLPRGYTNGGKLYPGWKMIDTNKDGTPDPVKDLRLIRQDNLASQRSKTMEILVEDATLYKTQGLPILIMGDFNEPSALDWTEATANLFDHNGVMYPWDATQTLMDDGFIDSYRELYPNPVTHPGFTWPTVAQGWNGEQLNTSWIPKADERDRIDFIFYWSLDGAGGVATGAESDNAVDGVKSSATSDAGAETSASAPATVPQGMRLQAVDSWLLGTPVSIAADKFVDESALFADTFSHSPDQMWPSDHRAVLTVFEAK